MKTLVTGGLGFIGSHLVELLIKEGHSVIVIDNLSTGRMQNVDSCIKNKRLKIVKADIANHKDIDKYFRGCDWVFHLAGMADIVPSIENPLKYHNVNVGGTINVLISSISHNVKRFIYAASSSCYGLAKKAKNTPTNEEDVIQLCHPYALTKYIGEEYALELGQIYKLPVISLRLFNVYGLRSRTSGAYGAVMGVFLKQKLENKPFTIVGNGTQTRDFVYVTDVAKAFYEAAKSKRSNEIFNIGSGNSYSVNLLADLISGRKRRKIYIPKRAGEPDCTHADITKAETLLKWKPEISFKDGIKKITDNIECWRDAPLWDNKSIAKATKTWFRYFK